MVDEYQVEYEYTDGNTISFKTNDLRIRYTRPKMRIDVRVDGTKEVTDPGNKQNIYTFTALIPAATMDTLDTIQRGAITYSGGYPRIKKIYWNGATTETNIEVGLDSLEVLDQGPSGWLVSIVLKEKDQ